jgi:hypothetical protein
LILSAANGQPGAPCYVLASTNLALPLSNWTRLATTNVFDPAGAFACTNAIESGLPQNFYRLQVP